MYCKNCGNEIADDSKFCPKCGYRIETEYPFEKYIFSDYYVTRHSMFSCVGFWLSILSVGGYGLGLYQIIFLAIPSLIFSIIGINQKRYTRKAFGYIGVVLSIISIILCFWHPPIIEYFFKA